jgi:hypothetical protein
MESQCFIAETPTEPPPKQRVAAPVASRGGDDKQITTVHTKPYTPISLLDKAVAASNHHRSPTFADS